MKKTFLPIVLSIFLLASCKKENPMENIDQIKDIASSAGVDVDNVVGQATDKVKELAGVKIPEFKSTELQSLAQDFQGVITDLPDAVKSVDAQKLQDIKAKVEEWGKKAEELKSKVSPEDLTKWQEYYGKIKELVNLK